MIMKRTRRTGIAKNAENNNERTLEKNQEGEETFDGEVGRR